MKYRHITQLMLTGTLFVITPVMANASEANISALYADTCAACHDTGELGSPKTGDKAVWNTLISQKGKPALVNNVKNGMPQMPAGGLCGECSDADFAALIDYMAQ